MQSYECSKLAEKNNNKTIIFILKKIYFTDIFNQFLVFYKEKIHRRGDMTE